MFKKIIEIIAFGPLVLFVLLLPVFGGGILGMSIWCIFEGALWSKILAVIAGIWLTILGYCIMFGDYV